MEHQRKMLDPNRRKKGSKVPVKTGTTARASDGTLSRKLRQYISLIILVGAILTYANSNTIAHELSKLHKHPSCQNPLIKGNVNYMTGEKIYHVPGDRFYNRTVIDKSQGERMFCTAKDALAAGWRASGT